MSDADETEEVAAQQANALRTASRIKYATGAERLRMGDDALALLSFHGALEDGLWAYLMGQGSPANSWSSLIEALSDDPERPLSAEGAMLLRDNHQLRNRIAHGEDVGIDRSEVAAYQQFAWQTLRSYGVSVDQRQPRPAVEREEPRRAAPSAAAVEDEPEPAIPRGRRDFLPADWRDQAMAQVQRNRQLMFPIAVGLVVFLVLCFALRLLFGGSSTPSAAVQTERPTLSLPTLNAATPPAAGTSLADQQATILPTTGPGGPAVVVVATPGAVPNVQPGGALVVGGRAIVAQQGDQLNLRTAPSTGGNSSVISALPAGTSLQIVEGPTQAEGFTWWRVRVNDQEGWVVGDFLSAAAGP